MTTTTRRPARPDFNQALIEDFRRNAGHATSGPFVGRNLLLLTTVGRRSGGENTVPLVYSRDDDRYVIVASKGGAPTNPAWYHNLVANPLVRVEVGTDSFTARARVAEGTERRRLFDRQAEENPGFREYEKRTTRQIPVITLERIPA
jgi:deazaflavin-dependent oxidoreductase (nitroreductase family)